MTQGVEVLMRMGIAVPALRLAPGPVMDEQGRQVEGLIASGWTPAELLAVLSVPIDSSTIRVSPAAVVAGRIRSLPMSPASAAPWVPMQQAAPGAPEVPAATAHDRTVAEAAARRTGAECRECGRPPESGIDLCAECAGWPLCGGCGMYRTPDGGECSSCRAAAAYASPEPEGLCAGHGGTCGVPVMEIGPYGLLCGLCECRAAQEARRERENFAVAVQQAAAAVAAEEGGSGTPAPF
ncbi:hypothetical protein ABWJ92_38510 [Streptomyces sp. NPDC000609]|uniref:hypothetical protein n=1 Tax=Streptomyces sp. NPDC000609 TaxID=3160957 RepID=UPI0033923FAB